MVFFTKLLELESDFWLQVRNYGLMNIQLDPFATRLIC